MRKYRYFLLIGMSILSVFMFVLLIYYSDNKEINEEFSTIVEAKSYVIEPNRQISFSVYTKNKNSLIIYSDKNTYTLILDSNSFLLENVTISQFPISSYYLIKIYADIPMVTKTECYAENAYLLIKNQKFSVSLNVGTMSFLSSNLYQLISIDSLSGSYSYINGELELVGINIEFSNNYNTLQEIRIGNTGYGILSKSIKGACFNNEIEILNIIPSYSIKYTNHEFLSLQKDKYFIPIGYNSLYLIRGGYLVIKLDGKNYYIDTFDFMVNELEISNYEKKIVKGEVKYAIH
ncbi:MAG: hypothetical protein ACI35S_08895 [Anaeroplasma sp.]